MRLRNYYETPSQTDDNQRYSYIRLQIGDLFMNRHTKWSLRGAAVAQWTATRRPGVRFPVGTMYLPSYTSFARDSKWECRLYRLGTTINLTMSCHVT